MHILTKKRLKAYLIDFTVAGTVTLGTEQLLRKKIKNDAFHAFVSQTLTTWDSSMPS